MIDEPWAALLVAGQPDAAWDAFIGRYRGLIFAGIRHYARDYDDVMEIFVHVCSAIREDNLRRLREYASRPIHRARFSTWLVTVVRHLTVDWFRKRDGRRRLPALANGLTPIRRQIFERVFVECRSHVEAFELIRTGEAPTMTFATFQVELREVYREAERRGRLLPGTSRASIPENDSDEWDPEEAAERVVLIERALASLDPKDRATVELYVIEGLPAPEVARIVGLPNAKAVYNRTYRALDALREWLAAAGVRKGDL